MRKLVTISTVALAALGAAPSALAAKSACDGSTTTTMFAAWGDTSQYTPFKGAGFESGSSGWAWGNKANIVGGDNNQLLGTPGSHVVELPSAGVAKSPWMCVDSTMPAMRFFLKRVSGTGNLTVVGQLKTPLFPTTTMLTVSGGSDWAPSPVLFFPAAFMAAVGMGTLDAQFQFIADPGTVYRIDDVAMDPFKSR